MKTVTKEQRIKMDCALAYFMGWRIDNSFPDKGRVWRKGNSVELDTTFKFSTDWNWLMEVYEAINNTDGLSASISPGHCTIHELGELQWEAPHKEPPIELIEAVYRCFGEFISVYNERQCTK